jgi:hypothetical protein
MRVPGLLAWWLALSLRLQSDELPDFHLHDEVDSFTRELQNCREGELEPFLPQLVRMLIENPLEPTLETVLADKCALNMPFGLRVCWLLQVRRTLRGRSTYRTPSHLRLRKAMSQKACSGIDNYPHRRSGRSKCCECDTCNPAQQGIESVVWRQVMDSATLYGRNEPQEVMELRAA